MLRRGLLFLSEREGLKNLLLKASIARRFARRFVAGETVEEALAAAKQLNHAGFRVTLDLLGESVSDQAEAVAGAAAYMDSLELIAQSEATSTISLKLTQLGLDIDEGLCVSNLEKIVERAGELGSFVRIDMEDSTHTGPTLRVFRRVFSRHHNVGVVIQSYLHRSADDLSRLLATSAPVRLCKGAYNEPSTVAYSRREDIDTRYVQMMKRLLGAAAEVEPTHGVPMAALATHDHEIIEAARVYAEEEGIPSDRFEFQMLYGVRRDVQALLVEQGYGMRIYVPYGTQWYPYLMRRMAERPANLAFVARAALGD